MTKNITLFLCGDVMLGRAIDQILPHPGDLLLRELYVGSAKQLTERVNGPIPAPVDFSYVWGDALDELRHAAPQARIINLETSVTQSLVYAPKGINTLSA
jgi:poly-gamma-glutamate synthesis protein (capsule biosynthesis protein)